jgi:hypothetical protein
LGATLCRSAIACALLLAVVPARAIAQDQDQGAPPAQPNEHPIAATVKFLAGGAIGLAAHESGHLLVDAAFDASPRVVGVSYGPLPFFAITHRGGLSPRREFAIDAAGFWIQEGTAEWLLTSRPYLRNERAPLVKGVLAFDVLTSIGYAATAFAKAGPSERDTRGMAAALGVNERAVGVLVLAPAVLDAYRYFRPESAWAKWASRVVKAGTVLVVIK